MNKTLINKACDFISENEGFSPAIYKCPAGYKTIGFGRNLELNPLSSDERVFIDKDGCINRENALRLLKNDIKNILELLKDKPYFESLSENRQIVIIDMCFNLGFYKFDKQFKKLQGCLIIGDFERASKEIIDSRYYVQVGSRAKKNAQILKSGDFLNLN